MAVTNSEQVSPTAYATGYFWYRHGLSHEAFATPRGRRIDFAFELLARASKALSGYSIEALMLARHKGIDAQLKKAIDSGQVAQVIEIAAGLSPRGWSFMQRYGRRLHYIESDLPAMAATKRAMLERAGAQPTQHRVVELDALADDGPNSLSAIAAKLDPNVGTAIITEGLMNYLDPESAQAVWRRIATTLQRFPHGVYFSDIYFQERKVHPALAVFGTLLGKFVRGRMHMHFETPADVSRIMKAAGFTRVRAIKTDAIAATREYAKVRGGDAVRVLEAWVPSKDAASR